MWLFHRSASLLSRIVAFSCLLSLATASLSTTSGAWGIVDPTKLQPPPSQSQSASSKLLSQLLQGAILRIASDLSIGTPLECIKSHVTVTRDNMMQGYHHIVTESGFGSLWRGTPSRTVEGALSGALFLLASSITKQYLLETVGVSPTTAAIVAGTIGGIAQGIVMTPSGLIYTSLTVNRKRPGYEHDTFLSVATRIVNTKGIRKGLFAGSGPMCLRQASNWASRSAFTEIARTTFHLSQYGLIGELISGIIGGFMSCWNTPIETIRVLLQQDVSMGKPAHSFRTYWHHIVQDSGLGGLYRGVTPRFLQAIWQTVFLVVVPNMLGL